MSASDLFGLCIGGSALIASAVFLFMVYTRPRGFEWLILPRQGGNPPPVRRRRRPRSRN